MNWILFTCFKLSFFKSVCFNFYDKKIKLGDGARVYEREEFKT